MCGILGFVNCGEAGDRKLATYALQSRGTEGTGLLWQDGKGDWVLYRKGNSAKETIINQEAEDAWAAPVMLCHLRAASSQLSYPGGKADKNTHPFTNGNITLAHNGYVSNWEELAKKHFPDRKEPFNVDSDVLSAMVDKFGVKGLDEISGYAACWWYDSATPELIYLWKCRGDMVFWEGKGRFAFASTRDYLELAGLGGKEHKLEQWSEEGQLCSVNVKTGKLQALGCHKGVEIAKVFTYNGKADFDRRLPSRYARIHTGFNRNHWADDDDDDDRSGYVTSATGRVQVWTSHRGGGQTVYTLPRICLNCRYMLGRDAVCGQCDKVTRDRFELDPKLGTEIADTRVKEKPKGGNKGGNGMGLPKKKQAFKQLKLQSTSVAFKLAPWYFLLRMWHGKMSLICPICHTFVDGTTGNCTYCGSKAEQRLVSRWKVCSMCGLPMASTADVTITGCPACSSQTLSGMTRPVCGDMASYASSEGIVEIERKKLMGTLWLYFDHELEQTKTMTLRFLPTDLYKTHTLFVGNATMADYWMADVRGLNPDPDSLDQYPSDD